MKKEWYTSKELIGVAGLPRTPQAINERARKNNWRKRKKQGIQGKAVEYYLDDLPKEVQHTLKMRDESPAYLIDDYVLAKRIQPDPYAVWVSAYHQLTVKEREQLISLLIRIGVDGVMALINKSLQEI